MGVEELRFNTSSIGTLAIPSLSTVAEDNVTRGTLDGDLGTRDGDKRNLPLPLTEAGGTPVVPSVSLVRSRVVPAGTAMSFRTIDVQEALP